MSAIESYDLPDRARANVADVIDAAIDKADRDLDTLLADGDHEAIAHGLADLRDMQRKLSMLERRADGGLAKILRDRGEKRTEIDDLGILEVHRRSQRVRWESERLFGLLVDRLRSQALAPDPVTGEVGDDRTASLMVNLMRDVLAPCLPLTASTGWRIGGLKAAGVDPEQYREREIGPDTVRIIEPDGVGF